jgi:hypothetical protein
MAGAGVACDFAGARDVGLAFARAIFAAASAAGLAAGIVLAAERVFSAGGVVSAGAEFVATFDELHPGGGTTCTML